MNIKKSLLPLLSLLLFTVACGSSSGFDDGPQVTITDPSNDQAFASGSRIIVRLTTRNFVLGPPNDFNSSAEDSHDDGESSVEDTHDDDAARTSQLVEQAGSGDGHYHLYLDDAVASDPHVTAWTDVVDYEIPGDLPAGIHSFRLELRDNDHQIVGVEDVVFFRIEN